MKLYNTRTEAVETFEPLGEVVTVYVCGVTPYDTTHIGHAFTYTANDILIRYLKHLGHDVKYVQNVTDVDDDILEKAARVDEDWLALGNRWTRYYIHDMEALNVLPPDHFPRATDVIPQMIATIERLLELDKAYEVEGNVYFRVDSWGEFGKLSRMPRHEMLPVANERGNNPDDPHKADPLDFVLWQAAVPDEPSWSSPWGDGRPGWHIECSTMARHYLGDTIDIHSGGADLLFPHHECEIAQIEPVTGQEPFARFWLHTAMVHHRGEKMSKSLGNLVMVRDLYERWSPDAVRVYLGRHHYREEWPHNPRELQLAQDSVTLLEEALRRTGGRSGVFDASRGTTEFRQAMDNDLQTGAAIAALERLAQSILDADMGLNLDAAQQALREMAHVFGLNLLHGGPDDQVEAGWQTHLRRFAEPEPERESK